MPGGKKLPKTKKVGGGGGFNQTKKNFPNLKKP